MIDGTPMKGNPVSQRAIAVALVIGALLVAALLVWQAITAGGTPDPIAPGTGGPTAVLDIAVLVFREGLECMLVLTAITAGLLGSNEAYRRPIALGVLAGMAATLITWFVAVNIIDNLLENVSALALQALTGLLAIIVLLIVMNWFFHKVYWTGWISMHNRRKRTLLKDAQAGAGSRAHVLWGLALLGFTSFYREGFEVVLFLQSYRLRLGDDLVLYGALLGSIFVAIVAVLNFVGHHHLPYKRMLVITGVLLAGVLFVMVGEEIVEMQLAGWIGTTPIPALAWLPDWAGLWFSIFPNWETIIAQGLALVLVLGSYFLAEYQAVKLPKKQGASPFQLRDAPPSDENLPARPLP